MPPSQAPLLVVLPGNPGDPAFYDDFARHLRAHGHDVLVSAHAPLDVAPSGDLRAHAEHHARTVRAHLAATGRAQAAPPLVLVGHSVGAYFAYLLVHHGLLPVARVFMLCPFLARPRWTGRLLLWALGRRRLVALVTSAFRALSARLQRWCLARGGAGSQADTARKMLQSSALVGAAVAMAARERAEIVPRPNSRYLQEHELFRSPARFAAFLCPGDPWAPASITNALAPHAHWFPRSIGHAFVVHPDQCRQVAEALHRALSGEHLHTAS